MWQGAPLYCAMILRSLCRRSSLPFFVSISVLTARIYNYIMIRNHIYSPQLCTGHDANFRSNLFIQDTELCNKQSVDSGFLGSKHDHIRLALHFICSTANLKVYTTPKQIGFNGKCKQKNTERGRFWRILSTNEQYLTYIGALVTLQLFLQLSRANITTLLLPMLYQTTSSQRNAAVVGNIVIVLVNSFGILGSDFTTKHHGREVTFTVSAILMVFCQVTNWPGKKSPIFSHLVVYVHTEHKRIAVHGWNYNLQDHNPIACGSANRAGRWNSDTDGLHHGDIPAHMHRLLWSQLVMGLIVLHYSWYEDSVSWAGYRHGSQFRTLLRANAVLPADAVSAEERHPCILRNVDLVLI